MTSSEQISIHGAEFEGWGFLKLQRHGSLAACHTNTGGVTTDSTPLPPSPPSHPPSLPAASSAPVLLGNGIERLSMCHAMCTFNTHCIFPLVQGLPLHKLHILEQSVVRKGHLPGASLAQPSCVQGFGYVLPVTVGRGPRSRPHKQNATLPPTTVCQQLQGCCLCVCCVSVRNRM